MNVYFEQPPLFEGLSWGHITYDKINLSHSSVCLHMSDCKQGKEAPDSSSSDNAGTDFQGWNSSVTLTAIFCIFLISDLSFDISASGHFILCLWSSEAVAFPPHLKYSVYYTIFSLVQLCSNPFIKVV